MRSGCHEAEEQLTERFKTGEGLGWHEHHHELFVGHERFFPSGLRANLIASWIPALSGVDAKLKSGARVADVAAGLGASTILYGQILLQSPNSSGSTITANPSNGEGRAKDAGVGDRIRFESRQAKNIPARTMIL